MECGTASGLSPVYAKIRDVLVPLRDDEMHMHHGEILSKVQRGRGFEAVYAGIRTKTVQMEERNVYCGRYDALLLLDKVDPYRVTDYSGGQVVAVGSKDRTVRQLDVVTLKEVGPGIQGHAGSIQAVLLCENREMVISASYDLSIRVWNLKTGVCIMMFRGHTDTICCLDLHEDRLASGAKDCVVKMWNMRTGACYEKLKFKHQNPIQCVKIDASMVVSSCNGGIVKVWAIGSASLIKVIDAHQGSVSCLFFDICHILTGGVDGQVMTWSTFPDIKICLMNYTHPAEVVAVSLHFLRVITGCTDGKIRIFDFLTGDCLKDIRAGEHPNPLFIVVNSVSSVILFQFARVRWQYSVGQVVEREFRTTFQCSTKGILKKTTLKQPNRKIALRKDRETKKAALSDSGDAHPSLFLQPTQAKEFRRTTRWVMTSSERAVQERVKKNAAERMHGWTNTSQQPLNKGLNGVINMNLTSKVSPAQQRPLAAQDTHLKSQHSAVKKQSSESSPAPHRIFQGMVKTYVPLLTKPLDLKLKHSFHSRDVRSTIPAPCLVRPKTAHSFMERPACRQNEKKRPRSSCGIQKVGTLTTTADCGRAPECSLMPATCKRPGRHVDFDIPTPTQPATASHKRLDPFREHGTFSLLTDTQIEDYFRAHRQSSQWRPTQESGERQRKVAWKMKMKGVPTIDYTKEDMVYAPELGDDIYI
ncbi:F-box/WD repeat-containing protein 10-like [Aplochiton taeniatus]